MLSAEKSANENGVGDVNCRFVRILWGVVPRGVASGS